MDAAEPMETDAKGQGESQSYTVNKSSCSIDANKREGLFSLFENAIKGDTAILQKAPKNGSQANTADCGGNNGVNVEGADNKSDTSEKTEDYEQDDLKDLVEKGNRGEGDQGMSDVGNAAEQDDDKALAGSHYNDNNSSITLDGTKQTAISPLDGTKQTAIIPAQHTIQMVKEEPQEFHCHKCQRVFSRKMGLITHLRSHKKQGLISMKQKPRYPKPQQHIPLCTGRLNCNRLDIL